MSDKTYEIVKFVDDEFELEVNVSPMEDTVWLTQAQIARLFSRDRSVISKHIKSIFEEHECDEITNVHFLHIANSDKPVEVYNLDVIISVGYRVKSKRGVLFRKWANSILKQYLLKGYAINSTRVLVTSDNYLDLVNMVNHIDSKQLQLENRIENLENNHPEFVNKLFFKGQFWDATSLIEEIIEKAEETIVLIDNYIDKKTLDIISKKKKGVNITIYTSEKGCNLTRKEVFDFNRQYENLEIKTTEQFHDRFLILDNQKLFYIGSSIKDAGKKGFAIIENKEQTVLKAIIESL